MSKPRSAPTFSDRNTKERLSRKLSYVLRHGAVDLNLPVDSAGFVPVSLLRTRVQGLDSLTDHKLRDIVAENSKKRFSLQTDKHGCLHVRANQGHSDAVAALIDPTMLLDRVTLENFPHACIHGTTFDAWQQIKHDGLSRMNRDMIHFATGLPNDRTVVSGMRNTSEVLVYVRLTAALEDGVPFYRSENNVLLTPGVGDSVLLPSRYFEKVIRRDSGETLLTTS